MGRWLEYSHHTGRRKAIRHRDRDRSQAAGDDLFTLDLSPLGEPTENDSSPFGATVLGGRPCVTPACHRVHFSEGVHGNGAMPRWRGNCYDALVESFFSTVKSELGGH